MPEPFVILALPTIFTVLAAIAFLRAGAPCTGPGANCPIRAAGTSPDRCWSIFSRSPSRSRPMRCGSDYLSGASLFHSRGAEDAGNAEIHRLVRRHVLLLLVASHPPPEGLLGDLPSRCITHRRGSRRSPGSLRAPGLDSYRVGTLCRRHSLFPARGCALGGALWFNFFAATGEFFYHANFKWPRWLKYIIQSPSCIGIITSSTCITTTTATFRSGTGCSAPIATPTRSSRNAASRATTSRKLAQMLVFRNVSTTPRRAQKRRG